MLTRSRTTMRSSDHSRRNGAPRSPALLAILPLMASLTCAAKADPIPATVTLTVEPTGSGLTAVPHMYTGCIADLNSSPSYVFLLGPMLVDPYHSLPYPPLHIDIQTTFEMTITLDGALGSHPSIDVKGNVTGTLEETDVTSSSPFWPEYNLSASFTVSGTGTSATLRDWTPDSGVPMSLINQYLNPSSYVFSQEASDMEKVGPIELRSGGSSLRIELPAAAEAPEPAPILVFLAAIAGLGVRRRFRLRRCSTTR